MALKLLGTLENTSLWHTTDQGFVAQSIGDDRYIAGYTNKIETKWKFPTSETPVHFTDTHTKDYIIYDNYESTFIDKESGAVSKKEPARYYYQYQTNTIAYRIQRDYALNIEHNNHHVRIDDESSTKYFIENYLVQVSATNKLIKANSLETGELIWEIKFLKFGDRNLSLYSDLIHYQGKLFFFLADGRNTSKTIVVNIHTGNVLHQTSDFGGYLRFDAGKIYAVTGHHSISILDTDSYKISTLNFEEILNKNGSIPLEWNVYLVRGSDFYFTTSFEPLIGIINIDSQQLIQLDTFSRKGSARASHINIHGDKLFMHIGIHKLSIFQL